MLFKVLGGSRAGGLCLTDDVEPAQPSRELPRCGPGTCKSHPAQVPQEQEWFIRVFSHLVKGTLPKPTCPPPHPFSLLW